MACCVKRQGITVKFKELTPGSVKPERKSEGAAGFDLAVNKDYDLPPGKVVVLNTGYAVEIPQGYEGQVRIRSSWGKKGVIVTNSPGTIDWDYRGELKILVMNLTGETIRIKTGERIAQLVIAPIANVGMVEFVGELSDTQRGEGGFGSTGTGVVTSGRTTIADAEAGDTLTIERAAELVVHASYHAVQEAVKELDKELDKETGMVNGCYVPRAAHVGSVNSPVELKALQDAWVDVNIGNTESAFTHFDYTEGVTKAARELAIDSFDAVNEAFASLGVDGYHNSDSRGLISDYHIKKYNLNVTAFGTDAVTPPYPENKEYLVGISQADVDKAAIPLGELQDTLSFCANRKIRLIITNNK
jgi:dUTP pyrophosphatase